MASFEISSNGLLEMASHLVEKEFKVTRMDSLEELSAYNKKHCAANAEGQNGLYPTGNVVNTCIACLVIQITVGQ